MKAIVHIGLKNGVLDPQGRAIANSLNDLGFESVTNARQGKVIEIDLNAKSADEAKDQVDAMCKKLLANMVIENYRITIED